MHLVEIVSILVLGGGFLALALALFYQQIIHFKQIKKQIQQDKDRAILEPSTTVNTGETITEDAATIVMKALISMQGGTTAKGRAAGY